MVAARESKRTFAPLFIRMAATSIRKAASSGVALTGAAILASLLCACVPDESGKTRCTTDEDCNPGLVCVEEHCAAPGPGTSGGASDAGQSSGETGAAEGGETRTEAGGEPTEGGSATGEGGTSGEQGTASGGDGAPDRGALPVCDDAGCGAGCPVCANGETCGSGADCASGLCSAGKVCSAWIDSFGAGALAVSTNQAVYGMGSDSEGNLFVLARLDVSAAADVTVGGVVQHLPAAGAFFVIVKYSSEGRVLWSKLVEQGPALAALAVAPDGNVWVAGTSHGAQDLGSGVLPYHGGDDVLLAAYSGDTGMLLEAAQVGGAGNESARAIAVTPDGGIVVAGASDAQTDFGQQLLGNAGGKDAFVARFDLDGERLVPTWATPLGGSKDETATSVSIDSEGRVVAAVQFESADWIDPTTNQPYKHDTDEDLAIVRLPAAGGALLWVKTLNGPSVENGFVAAGPLGLAVFGWSFNYSADPVSIDFEGKMASCPTYTCGWGAAMDASGAVRWVNTVRGTNDYARVMLLDGCTDPSGNLVLVGNAAGPLAVDQKLFPDSGLGILLTKFAVDDGRSIDAELFTFNNDSSADRVVCRPRSNGIVIGGYFGGALSLAGRQRTATGGFDAYVAGYGPFPP